jgi:hypothetical protein
MLAYTQIEADLFINRHFATATNKDEIFEFFIWIANDQNFQTAKMLTFSKFKK